MLVTDEGVVGSVTGGEFHGPDLPAVQVDGEFSVAIDTTATDPFVSVQLANAEITVLGNTFTADTLSFETSGTTVTLAGTNVGLRLEAGGRRVLEISGATLAFDFDSVPDGTDMKLLVVTGSVTNAAVHGPDFGDTFSIAGVVAVQIDTDAGYVRVDLTPINATTPLIRILGAALTAQTISLRLVLGADGAENTVDLTANTFRSRSATAAPRTL